MHQCFKTPYLEGHTQQDKTNGLKTFVRSNMDLRIIAAKAVVFVLSDFVLYFVYEGLEL